MYALIENHALIAEIFEELQGAIVVRVMLSLVWDVFWPLYLIGFSFICGH